MHKEKVCGLQGYLTHQDGRCAGLVCTLGHVPRTVLELKGLLAQFICVGGTQSTTWSKIHSKSKIFRSTFKIEPFSTILACRYGLRKMQAKFLNFQSLCIRYASFFVQQFYRIIAFPSLTHRLSNTLAVSYSALVMSRYAEQYLKETAMEHFDDHYQHIPKYIP